MHVHASRKRKRQEEEVEEEEDQTTTPPSTDSDDWHESDDDVPLTYWDRSEFPYPIGTKVAFPFEAGVFAGKIIKHFNDADTCLVRFTDGDEKELDRPETLHAIQLYDHKFSA